MSATEVEYRPVPGFPGYRVGGDGSVWSRWKRQNRYGGDRLADKWRRLSLSRHHKGYLHVTLYRQGRRYPRRVHTLVLEAFVGTRPRRQECRHLDGDRANNRRENLRWGTRKENRDDARRHGTLTRGERMGTAKLTDGKVRAIRCLAESGWPCRAIAPLFDVTAGNVSAVVRRQTWKHVA